MELEVLAKEYIFDCQARELSPRTIAGYEKQLRYFLRFLDEALGVRTLEELKPAHIKQYVVMRQKKNNALRPKVEILVQNGGLTFTAAVKVK